MTKDQMFEQMDQVALSWLAERDPHELARNAGVQYDAAKQEFRFSSMGIDLTLAYPSYEITPAVDRWHRLAILHYLHLADGAPLTGREITFSQMRSGMIRGGGIDRKCELAIQSMKDLNERKLSRICEALGGQKIKTNADVAYCIPFLPRFPVTLKVWLPDEEFPASGRLLVDASADHYFTIEDAVTVAEILIERIAVPTSRQVFSAVNAQERT